MPVCRASAAALTALVVLLLAAGGPEEMTLRVEVDEESTFHLIGLMDARTRGGFT